MRKAWQGRTFELVDKINGAEKQCMECHAYMNHNR